MREYKMRKTVFMKMKLIALSYIFLLSIGGCSHKDPITPKTIISQLPAGHGWLVKKVNRPNFYKYKIARDSGYATITVSVLKKELFCKYNFKEYETAIDLSQAVSFSDLKKQFEECEGEDERAIPILHSIKETSLGGIPALLFISDYHNINPEVNIGIEYYVIRAEKGWIIIGTSFIRNDEHLYRKEFQKKLKAIKL